MSDYIIAIAVIICVASSGFVIYQSRLCEKKRKACETLASTAWNAAGESEHFLRETSRRANIAQRHCESASRVESRVNGVAVEIKRNSQ